MRFNLQIYGIQKNSEPKTNPPSTTNNTNLIDMNHSMTTSQYLRSLNPFMNTNSTYEREREREKERERDHTSLFPWSF